MGSPHDQSCGGAAAVDLGGIPEEDDPECADRDEDPEEGGYSRAVSEVEVEERPSIARLQSDQGFSHR